MSAGRGGRSRVEFKITADEADAVRGFLNVSRAMDTSGQAAQRMGQKSKTANDQMLGGLTSMITKYGMLAIGVRAATAAMMAHREEQKKGAEGRVSQAESLGKLIQISKGDPVLMGQLKRERDFLRGQFGFNAQDAGEMVFQIRSSDQQKNLGLAGALQKIGGIQDVAGLARGVKKSQLGFGAEAGDFRDMVNRAGTAAVRDIASTPEILEQFTKISATAKSVGININQGLAMVSTLITVAKEADVGGTQATALVAFMQGQGITGGLPELLEKFGDIKDPQKLKRAIPNIRAMQGFMNLVANEEMTTAKEGRIAESVKKGTSNDFVAGLLRVGDKFIGKETRFQASEQLLKISLENQADKELGLRTIQNTQNAMSINEGHSSARRTTENFAKHFLGEGILTITEGTVNALGGDSQIFENINAGSEARFQEGSAQIVGPNAQWQLLSNELKKGNAIQERAVGKNGALNPTVNSN